MVLSTRSVIVVTMDNKKTPRLLRSPVVVLVPLETVDVPIVAGQIEKVSSWEL